MKKLILSTIAAAAMVIPAAAQAQRAPAAVIITVNTDRIARDCTACRAATTTIQGQQNALRTRAQTLAQQLETESKPIQNAVNALNGKAPDAALQARITAFQTKQQNAQRELAASERNIQSTQVNVNQQIGARLRTIISSVATARGANIALDSGATLYSAPAVDVTDAVLAQLNQQLPAVSVTPLPQTQQPAPSQGR
ncbi:MAG TPA: OmpH family outer membrane protein [Sphingomicrobium sp.]|nr:OmpH family outer membrane protein [Sphingomicrobium sp.]